ncbi:hypothetical protein HYU11_01895 [Candidatus Woesearchaeota archaeon]|nr:hypothetical protein [Candidatus Woesearchaeota archaeon]
MKSAKNIDYIRLHAEKIRKDSRHFAQQKMLIDSQIQASRSFFQRKFSGKDFNTEARKHLKGIGLL